MIRTHALHIERGVFYSLRDSIGADGCEYMRLNQAHYDLMVGDQVSVAPQQKLCKCALAPTEITMIVLSLFNKPTPVKLNSKTIHRALYFPDSGKLVVWLSKRRRNHYGVTQGVYDNLITAEDPDFYYSMYIDYGQKKKPALIKWAILIALVTLVTLPFWLPHIL